MIKNIVSFNPDALIAEDQFRAFAEKFESEILRGISTLAILSIIQASGKEGTYGYQILKELGEKTKIGDKQILIIEEGTLYPILKKLKRDGILTSEKKEHNGRIRTYYRLTEAGFRTYNHILGFFTKLIESISPILDVKVALQDDRFAYCPNCANKIDLQDEDVKFCDICGLNIENLKKRGIGNE
ncbi:MAG: hypothetical protein EAX96_16690 [Candidatus Lokiarchaeota archaeon]|nr:hypothetical protein [Candidatus Lokiarchaeota archaeon]